jgi:lipoprotein-anchoring transpeptidase ErfK/SrfK
VADGSASARAPAADPDGIAGRHLVVSLAEHRLYLMDGARVLWSTVVGTGTGTRLAGAGQRWSFSTPRGMFRVQMRQKNPVWILPDWYFVERHEPVPPADSPRRRLAGALGSSALFLGEEIAIHGTERPDLLGDDVSHGCIRVSNEAARRLYHEVDVGTPVLIY